MQKVILAILLAAVLLVALTGCSSGKTETTPVAGTSSPGAVLQPADTAKIAELLNNQKLIMVYQAEKAETMVEKWEKIYSQYLPGFKFKEITYVDSLTDGILMLRSGRANALQVMENTAQYLIKRDSNLVAYQSPGWESYIHMIFNQDKQSQYDKVNTAIKAMKKDGTLARLMDQWIMKLPAAEEPSGGKMPEIAGAETLKVGISGDEPPLDYIAADGTPGGFNVAVLSEISKRAQINIVMVNVTGGSRFAALDSGKIEAFLWHMSARTPGDQTQTPSTTVTIGDHTLLMTDYYKEGASAMVFVRK